MNSKLTLSLFLILLFGALCFINHEINSSVNWTQTASVSTASAAHADRRPANLMAADAHQFGIDLESTDESAKSENEWNSEMSRTLAKPGIIEHLDQQGILEDLKDNPGKFKEKMDRVEDEIKQQEVRIRQYPSNPDEKTRLQSLYMLKATLAAIGEEINAGHTSR